MGAVDGMCRYCLTRPDGSRAAPRCRALTREFQEAPRQMRLIRKSTFKRNVAQRHIGLKHVLSSQFDATPDHKGVGGVPECAFKGARKVPFAALYQCT